MWAQPEDTMNAAITAAIAAAHAAREASDNAIRTAYATDTAEAWAVADAARENLSRARRAVDELAAAHLAPIAARRRETGRELVRAARLAQLAEDNGAPDEVLAAADRAWRQASDAADAADDAWSDAADAWREILTAL
jgi:hypothetical protein